MIGQRHKILPSMPNIHHCCCRTEKPSLPHIHPQPKRTSPLARWRHATTHKSNERQFYAVLKNKIQFIELKGLMQRELCIENALFIEEYTILLEGKSDKITCGFGFEDFPSPEEEAEHNSLLKLEIHKLFMKFVVNGAQHQLNITSNLTDYITKRFNSEEGAGLEIFNPVLKEVHCMIYQNTFQRFLAMSQRKMDVIPSTGKSSSKILKTAATTAIAMP